MDECIEKTREDGCSRKEQRSEMIFVNTKLEELVIITIDGCVVTGPVERCDFMVQHGVINYYVELKGNRYRRKAIEQLANSINMLNEELFDGRSCKAIIVVANQVPKYKTLKRARREFKELLDSDTHCPLTIKNSPYFHPFS